MIELTQHIEKLLYDNDCIIVPNFGGFVAFYNHAQNNEDENTFYPPTRTIGFNPRLTLNDGMLIQSYMSVHDISFSDAAHMIEKEVEQLQSQLQETGKVELTNIGEIKLTMHQTYEFTPYNEKLTSPSLYGLDSVELVELSKLTEPKEERVLQPVQLQENKKNYNIRINRAFVRTIAASVAAIALFFFLSTPVENTSIIKGSYANLLPTDIFETIESKSILTTPLSVSNARSEKAKVQTPIKPVTVKEVKVAAKTSPEPVVKTNVTVAANTPVAEVKTAATPEVKTTVVVETKTVSTPPVVNTKAATTGKYHIIVSSIIGQQQKAEEVAEKFKKAGHAGARVIPSGEKMRISIMSLPTREAAEKELASIRNNPAHSDAWLLVQ